MHDTKHTKWSMRALTTFCLARELQWSKRHASEERHWRNVNERGGKAECVGWPLRKASQRIVGIGPLTTVHRTAATRPTHPNHYEHGEEGHLQVEVGQCHKPIRNNVGDDQDSRWYTGATIRNFQATVSIRNSGRSQMTYDAQTRLCLRCSRLW